MILSWWNAWTDWATSVDGRDILTTAVLPFIAILAAGIFAAILARGGMARLVQRQDAEAKAAVIASALADARSAGAWASLSLAEQEQLDFRVAEAFAHLRMTASTGSDLAAEWGTLKVRVIKQKAMAGAGAAESEIRDLEDSLILWHRHPARAGRFFREDLETLRYKAAQPILSTAYVTTPNARVDTGDLQEILHR